MFEDTNDASLSRKRPKKRERIQQPDTEEDDDDDDDDTIGDRLDTSTNSRTYDTYNKANNSISDKDRTYKTKKDGSATTALPTIKVNTLPKQANESKANKHQYHSNGDTLKKTTIRIGTTSTTLADELTDSNSSSSDDQPLSQSSANSKKASKTFLGTVAPTNIASITTTITTKRKVEVLSKESGKIGVTIKTSPEVTPPNKLHCTNISATPITVPIKTEPAPLSPETPASHPESNTPPEKPSTSASTAGKLIYTYKLKKHILTLMDDHDHVAIAHFRFINSRRDLHVVYFFSSPISFHCIAKVEQPVGSQVEAFKSISTENSQETVQSIVEPTTDNVNNSKISNDFKIVTKRLPQIPTSPKPAPPRLWLSRSNVSDHVIITDVTVNKETVTIRECKKGFFLSQ